MFCTSCGAQLPDGTKFCTVCGADLSDAPQGGGSASAPPPPPPNWSSTPGPAAPFTPPSSVSVNTMGWITAGWDLVKADLVAWIVGALLMLVLSSVVPVILQGAMIIGLHIMAIKKLQNRTPEFADVFKGFNYFVPALVASLLISVGVFVGMIFCIIPGLVILAVTMFSYLFIVDRNMDFWPAIQASHEVVKLDYLGFTLFILALGVLQIVGALLCFVGLLVTLPIMYAAITVAYKETVGIASNPQ
jgi:uncharacterized membrane protein